MRTLDTVFDLFGGPANVGRIIGKSTEHAATMRRRRSVPLVHWAALIEASNEWPDASPLSEKELVALHVDAKTEAAA